MGAGRTWQYIGGKGERRGDVDREGEEQYPSYTWQVGGGSFYAIEGHPYLFPKHHGLSTTILLVHSCLVLASYKNIGI